MDVGSTMMASVRYDIEDCPYKFKHHLNVSPPELDRALVCFPRIVAEYRGNYLDSVAEVILDDQWVVRNCPLRVIGCRAFFRIY